MMLLLQGSPPLDYAIIHDGRHTDRFSWELAELLLNKPFTEAWKSHWSTGKGSMPWNQR